MNIFCLWVFFQKFNTLNTFLVHHYCIPSSTICSYCIYLWDFYFSRCRYVWDMKDLSSPYFSPKLIDWCVDLHTKIKWPRMHHTLASCTDPSFRLVCNSQYQQHTCMYTYVKKWPFADMLMWSAYLYRPVLACIGLYMPRYKWIMKLFSPMMYCGMRKITRSLL